MILVSVRRVLLAAAAMALSAPFTAHAATDTSQLSVSATVESGCALSGGTLNFGTYIAGQSADLDVNGSFSYSNCGPGTLSFELDGGLQSSNGNRFMTSGQEQLQYEIYRNAVRSAVWGQGADDQDIQLFATQNGTVDVYGRIPGGQSVSAGTYTDTVTITLTF